MNQQETKETNKELAGQLSPAEADLAGAFEEDALGLDDALASVTDEVLPASAMKG